MRTAAQNKTGFYSRKCLFSVKVVDLFEIFSDVALFIIIFCNFDPASLKINFVGAPFPLFCKIELSFTQSSI